MTAAGDAVIVYCRFVSPPHDKIAICVCPDENLYFFVNTKPWRLAEAQVLIREFELDCLTRDSYVDTSKVVTFSEIEMQSLRNRGPTSNALKLRIKTAVRGHRHLPQRQKALVEANF